MTIGLVHVDSAAFPAEPMPCLRCGADAMLRFAGPCPACTQTLRTKFAGRARAVETEAYAPKMHVTPNAVALKDD